MPTAYKGSKPYIFVSYAHKDSQTVVPILDAMQKKGYRIWFDQGIEAGTEWSNNIAAHLEDCSVFVVFASHNSVKSENCLDEIAFAKSHQKPSLLIFLQEDVVLPKGTEMQTARFQRMFYSRHASDEGFIEKLTEAPILDICREVPEVQEDVLEGVEELVAEQPRKAEAPAAPKHREEEPEDEFGDEPDKELADKEEFEETPEEKKARRKLGRGICTVGVLLELSYCAAGPWAMKWILTTFPNGWVRFLLMIVPHTLIALVIRLLTVKNAEKLTSSQQTDVFGYSLFAWFVSSILAVIIGAFKVPLEINGLLKFLLSLGLNVVPALIAVVSHFSILSIAENKCREKQSVS